MFQLSLFAIEPINTSKQTLYTIGYSGGTPGLKPTELLAFCEQCNAILVDVRLAARSRVRHWNKGVLTDTLGNSYIHVPNFGNVNYKGGDIELRNPVAGLQQLTPIFHSGKSVLLMCTCTSHVECHRNPVSDFLSSKTALPVEHLSIPALRNIIA